MADQNIVPGRVYPFEPGLQQPPTSSLTTAFYAKDGLLTDAVVLRGYLGRSPIIPRTRQYLEWAREAAETREKQWAEVVAAEQKAKTAKTAESTAKQAAVAAKKAAVAAEVTATRKAAAEATKQAVAAKDEAAQILRKYSAEQLTAPDEAPYDPPPTDDDAAAATAQAKQKAASQDAASILGLISTLDAITPAAEPHVPWRIYLTPALNRYVDFHLFSLLAWRQEPKTERRDTFTVWLRAFTSGGQPLPYRIIEETQVGPSFSTYLGGDLVDDFLGDSGTSGGAWGGGMYGGGKPGTGYRCGGKPGTGYRCGE